MKKRIQITITLENIPENSAASTIVDQPIKNKEKLKWLTDLVEAGRAHVVCVEDAPTSPVNPIRPMFPSALDLLNERMCTHSRVVSRDECPYCNATPHNS